MTGPRPLSDKSHARVRNRRVERTRTALLGAFRDLLLSGSYDDISVAMVAERADVGRSTFYEHFENRDALLRESLTPVLAPLATAVSDDPDNAAIRFVVDHFWENRLLVRAMFAGTARQIAPQYLGEMIERRLKRHAVASALSPALRGRHIAEAQLGLLYAWVTSASRVEADAVATALIATSRALARC